MKARKITSNCKGTSLVEVLIGLIVLAVGLLAVAKFHASLMESSSTAKARSEAVNLGQRKVEDLRNIMLNADYAGIVSGTDTVTGTNAAFARNWTITDRTNPTRKEVAMTVGWTDARSGSQSVMLNSIIAWIDPARGASLADPATLAGIAKPPIGRAKKVNKTYDSMPVSASDNEDGTSTYEDGTSTELIDNTTRKVLLVTEGTFSTVSGRVYIEGTSPDPRNKIYVVASDTGYCSRTILNPVGQAPATGTAVYTYFAYKCYVGKGWYGNIGILRIDNFNPNDRVCIGDPFVDSSDPKAVKLSYVRRYRGVAVRKNADGTDMLVDGSPVYINTGIAANTDYSGHHFLVTTITHAEDSDCIAPMTFNSFTGFADNPSKDFCMTDSCLQIPAL